MKWKNLKLGKKFFISFGLIIILLVGVGFWSTSGIGKIVQNAEEVIEGNILRTELEKKYVQHLLWSSEVSKILIDSTIMELNVETDPHQCAFGKWYYGEGRKNAEELAPGLKKYFDEIEEPHNHLHESAIQIDEVFLTDNKKANNIYLNETLSHLKKVGNLFDEIIENSKDYILTDDVMIQQANNTRWGVIIFSIIASIIAIIMAVVITKGIVNPMKKGVKFAEKISNGDLTATIDIEQNDEIGQLATALSIMVSKLKEVVLNVKGGADNIAAASQQMSSGSQEISQGASEQASSAEEVASSMEEMASNIQQNTDNSQQTEKIALQSVEGVNSGNESANISMVSMKEIAEKISIINDIAFQTNILALNAAVEAARAGEHGRGFAVVAAEVRKLAERSKIAADEIGILSKKGVDVSVEAGQKLSAIVPEIEKTSKLVQEITASSLEQNAGAEQINSALQQLNQVTQQNAASAEEMATSSEELSSQADQLKETISFFDVGDDDKKKVIKKINKPQVRPTIVKPIVKPTGVKIDLSSNASDDEFEKF
jgi:methyl-accepting chemotaxis protein